jgi:hypothetical protein
VMINAVTSFARLGWSSNGSIVFTWQSLQGPPTSLVKPGYSVPIALRVVAATDGSTSAYVSTDGGQSWPEFDRAPITWTGTSPAAVGLFTRPDVPAQLSVASFSQTS